MDDKPKKILKFIAIAVIFFIIGIFIGSYLAIDINYQKCQQDIFTKYNCIEKPIYPITDNITKNPIIIIQE